MCFCVSEEDDTSRREKTQKPRPEYHRIVSVMDRSSTSSWDIDDELDDEWFWFIDDMFLLVADCVSDEAWARAMDSGIPLNRSIAKLFAAGAGFFDESD